MFQCLIGCRVSDLNRLTKANIVDGFVEYIPQKTKMERANTVRVPLNQKARDILERYKDLESALLPRFSHFGYNKKIKEILKYVGIDRTVIVLDRRQGRMWQDLYTRSHLLIRRARPSSAISTGRSRIRT